VREKILRQRKRLVVVVENTMRLWLILYRYGQRQNDGQADRAFLAFENFEISARFVGQHVFD